MRIVLVELEGGALDMSIGYYAGPHTPVLNVDIEDAPVAPLIDHYQAALQAFSSAMEDVNG